MSPSCGKYRKGVLATAYAVAYAQYCNVFSFHCFMTHIPEATSLWLNVFHLTSCLPQTWGGGGWLKNSLQVGNKFIVFNLLSPALYAKCTCDTRRHTSKCRSICQHSGSANVVLSVVIYFICYVRAVFLSHLLARIVG